MIEKFNKNAKVENFTNILGIAVRLIVIDPYADVRLILSLYMASMAWFVYAVLRDFTSNAWTFYVTCMCYT